jgi:hypothetical protein
MDRRFCLALLTVPALSVMLGGCVANQPVAENVPPPRFNGPTIVRATPPRIAIGAPGITSKQVPAGVPRDWVPNAQSRPWKFIVIHHSATVSGSAGKFDREHRAKGWDELGYHFVVGNGTETRNGQVEVGSRWPKQKWGAHAKTADNRFNDYGIGICLVGNFDEQRPNAEQLRSTAKLVAYLMKTYRIPAAQVMGHKATKPTDCPGTNLNVAVITKMATQMMLADGGSAIDTEPEARTAAATELLTVDGVAN